MHDELNRLMGDATFAMYTGQDDMRKALVALDAFIKKATDPDLIRRAQGKARVALVRAYALLGRLGAAVTGPAVIESIKLLRSVYGSEAGPATNRRPSKNGSDHDPRDTGRTPQARSRRGTR
jgi:hypothetical protein